MLAGAPPGALVLDPFCGSGTVGEVALKLGRSFIGIELSAVYAETLARPRLAGVAPMLIDETDQRDTTQEAGCRNLDCLAHEN